MSLPVLEVAILPGKGRGYKAITDIPAGTTIHVSEPLATTVSQEWTPETCMWCFDFTYPKKQKVKAVDEQEQVILSQEWNLSSKKKKNANSAALFKDLFFCSQECKLKYEAHGCQPSDWNTMLTVFYRLDTEFKNSKNYDINVLATPLSSVIKDDHAKWIDINDDKALSLWLTDAWNCLTEDLKLYREIEDVDRSVCRLIASCILRKNGEEEGNVQQTSDTTSPQFKDFLDIQNNELTHFKSHFITVYPNHPNQLPLIYNHSNKKEAYLSIIPSEVLEVMALYSFFARAFYRHQSTTTVPTLPNVNHDIFRSIFFRERANSFGLWEMGDDEIAKADGGVTDDLELLGWGIYPSAVYFNHSCDANVIKVRDGRNMKFITRRMIEKDEEACISYGCVRTDVKSRRARLLEHYHFLCNCTRCIEDDLRDNTIPR